jgi:3-oxoacyl-[acyl-carrier protein] reductase
LWVNGSITGRLRGDDKSTLASDFAIQYLLVRKFVMIKVLLNLEVNEGAVERHSSQIGLLRLIDFSHFTRNMCMDLGLKNRNALVTGSSSGIGRATAQLLARHGARVAITYRHNRERAEIAARNALANGAADAVVSYLDLESPESIHSTVDGIISRWGAVDILVNNAIQRGPSSSPYSPELQSVSFPEWQQLVRANVEGPYIAVKAVVPSMKRQGWGRIVNVSSVFASTSCPIALDWYAVAKSAIHGILVSHYQELAAAGILMNTVMPGMTLTEHVAGNLPKVIRSFASQRSPLRRLPEPEEIARVITFLCSEANTTVVGEVIRTGGAN